MIIMADAHGYSRRGSGQYACGITYDEGSAATMPILRLAYTTQFLIALIAVFMLWSQVGGQSHLDLMPWYLKLGLGAGAALAVVKATVAAVSHKNPWNGSTLKWAGITLALLVGCGMATYYYHLYGETDEEQDQQDTQTSSLVMRIRPSYSGVKGRVSEPT